MEILIPSKNIYKIVNPKVKDNLIEQVSINEKVVNSILEVEHNVYSEDIPISFADYKKNRVETEKKDFDATFTSNGSAINGYYYSCVYLNNTMGYYETTLSVKRIKDNKFIEKIYNGEKDEIYYSVSGVESIRDISSKITSDPDKNFNENTAKMDYIKYGTKTEKEKVFQFPQFPIEVSDKYIIQGEQPLTPSVQGLSDDSKIEIEGYNILDNYINIKLKILCYVRIEKLTGRAVYSTLSQKHEIPMNGKLTTYTPNQISINIYGNTIELSLNDNAVSYGEGNKHFSLNGSEILQDKGRYYEESITKNISKEILNFYKNGNETATILCDISDYYEYDDSKENKKGQKVISINNKERMYFHLHDKVIPMVFGADGKETAMSKYFDGTPKVFEVTGTKMFYDGAVWQELTLKETPSSLIKNK